MRYDEIRATFTNMLTGLWKFKKMAAGFKSMAGSPKNKMQR